MSKSYNAAEILSNWSLEDCIAGLNSLDGGIGKIARAPGDDSYKRQDIINSLIEKGMLYNRYGGRAINHDDAQLLLCEPSYKATGPYYLMDRTDPKKYSVKEITLDEVMDFAQSSGEKDIDRPVMEPLGFWGTLRNVFSFIFGKPEAVKRYERRMEVYRAQKLNVLEEQFQFPDQAYDADLLNEDAAQQYVKDGRSPRILGRESVNIDVEKSSQDRRQDALQGRETINAMLLEDAMAMLSDEKLDFDTNAEVQTGAERLRAYINNNPNTEESKALVNYLAGVYQYQQKTEKDTGRVEKQMAIINKLCRDVSETTNLIDSSQKYEDNLLVNEGKIQKILKERMLKQLQNEVPSSGTGHKEHEKNVFVTE